jgi:hypothetical protein
MDGDRYFDCFVIKSKFIWNEVLLELYLFRHAYGQPKQFVVDELNLSVL